MVSHASKREPRQATSVATDPSVEGPRSGEVVLHVGLALIETADAVELTALLADRQLAELVVARIGPTAAVALPQHAERLVKALRAGGHTPTVAGASR